jgi:hypothetical protein
MLDLPEAGMPAKNDGHGRLHGGRWRIRQERLPVIA